MIAALGHAIMKTLITSVSSKRDQLRLRHDETSLELINLKKDPGEGRYNNALLGLTLLLFRYLEKEKVS